MPYQQVVTNPLLHQVGGEGTNIYRETPLSGAEATNPEQGGAGTEGVDRQLTPRVSNPDYTPSKEPMTATQVVEYFKNVAPNPNTGIYETGFNAYTSGGVPIFIFAPTRLASKDAAQVQAEIDRVKRDYYEGDQGGGGIGEEIESVVSAPVGGVQTEPPEGAKTAPGAKAPEGGGWYQGVGGYWHPTAMPPSGQEVSFEPGSAYEKQQLALAEKMKPEFAALWREGVRTGDFSKYQSAVQIAQGEGKEQWSHPLADQNAVDRDIQAWAKDNNVPLDEARQRFIDYLTNPTKFDNVQEKIRGLREVAVKHDLYGTGQIPFVATSEKGEQALSLLTPKQVRKLSGLKDEKLFNAMQEMGLYPADYTWAAAGGKGGILTGEQVDLLTSSTKERKNWERKIKEEEPELYKIYLSTINKTGDYDKGVAVYGKAKEAQQKKELIQWVESLPQEYQDIYKKNGIDVLLTRLDVDTKTYEQWAKQFTPQELEEMQSSKYKVPDETGQMIATTKKIYENHFTAQLIKDNWMKQVQTGIGMSSKNGKAVTVPTYGEAPDLVGALEAKAVTPQQLIDLGYDKNYINNLVYYINNGQISRSQGIANPDLLQIAAANLVQQPSITPVSKSILPTVDETTRARLLSLGFTNTDISKAVKSLNAMTLTYVGYIGKYGYDTFKQASDEGNLPYTSTGWKIPNIDKLKEDLNTFNANVAAKVAKSSHSTLEKALAGVGQFALTLGAGLIVEGTRAMVHPEKIPSIAYEMGSGAVKAIKTTAYPPNILKDPFGYGQAAAGTALVLQPMLGTGIRAAEFGATVLRSDYIPFRSMSAEAFTFRKMFTPEQMTKAREAEVTDTQFEAAGGDLVLQLAKGVKIAKVKLGTIEVEVKNVPYQTDVKGSLFNSTPDISLVERGVSVPLYKDFFTTARGAVEPMTRSYLEGTRAIDPGLIEIIGSDLDSIALLASKGKVFGEPFTMEPQLIFEGGNIFRLEPVPKAAGGHGVTFDATLGIIKIRRFTLSKITGNPTGLQETILGKTGKGGIVVTPDIHAAPNFSAVFEAINKRFNEPILKGDPNVPETWHVRADSPNTGFTVVQAGDLLGDAKSIPTYLRWRDAFNRLHDEAISTGVGRSERVLGNHELAILAKDEISGQPFTNIQRASIRPGIVNDIMSGRIKASVAADGKLVTHAGISSKVYPEFKGKSPTEIASSLDNTLINATKHNSFKGKDFAKGRVEKGHSLSKNERSQGGAYWLRPQEATAKQLDLGFEQIVGHNPGTGIRQIWNKNFIETDVGVKFGGDVSTYANTPFVRTESVPIRTAPLGKVPANYNLSPVTLAKLKAKAVRDTLADFVLGWDGRSYAIDMLRANKKAMKVKLEELKIQKAQRKVDDDSIGVKYVQRQISELKNPTMHDYVYGGIAFWRDIIMGRQNTMKILSEGVAKNPKGAIGALSSIYGRISQLSNYDINRLFGVDKNTALQLLSTKGISSNNYEVLESKLSSLRDIVDTGVEREIAPYLNENELATSYAGNYRSLLKEAMENRIPTYQPYKTTPETPPRTPETTTPRIPNVPSVYNTPTYSGITSTPPPYFTPLPYIPPPPPPPPTGIVTPTPKPVPILMSGASKFGADKKSYDGAVAWAQGALRRKGGNLETQYIVWSYPYTQDRLEYFSKDNVPVGVKVVPNISSAKETIQQFRGKLPPNQAQLADIGAFLATVDKPTPEPGGKGEIKFIRDNPEALRKIALGTTIKQLLLEVYPDRVPKKTADRILAEKLSNTTPAVIANELKQANVTNARKREVLAKLPDRERQQVQSILSSPVTEAPTRNLPKAFYQPVSLRRTKTKVKTTKKKTITTLPAQIWGMPL